MNFSIAFPWLRNSGRAGYPCFALCFSTVHEHLPIASSWFWKQTTCRWIWMCIVCGIRMPACWLRRAWTCAPWQVCWVTHRQVQRWIFTPTHLTRTNARHRKNWERRLDYEKNQADTSEQKYPAESVGTLLLPWKGTWAYHTRNWKANTENWFSPSR